MSNTDPHSTLQQNQKWENVFQKKSWGAYPSEELIRFMARTFYQHPDRSAIQVLDLGCGSGANTWYAAREGFSVTALDCSQSALDTAAEKLAADQLSARFHLGSFEQLPFKTEQFDVVLDNCSIGSSPINEAAIALAEVFRVLKPGGYYYGYMLGKGCTIKGNHTSQPDDPWYFSDITDGPLKRAATVRLYDEADVRQVFSSLGYDEIDINVATRTVDHQREKVETWHTAARKPAS